MKTGWVAIGVALLVALAFWCWHPVCVPIDNEELKLFTPAGIRERASEKQWGVQTFQQRDGQWCQCKPWLARQLFF